jgi:hypothetical protein
LSGGGHRTGPNRHATSHDCQKGAYSR